MRGATPRLTISLCKDGKTAIVMFVARQNRSYKYGGVKERLHRLIPKDLTLRSSRTF